MYMEKGVLTRISLVVGIDQPILYNLGPYCIKCLHIVLPFHVSLLLKMNLTSYDHNFFNHVTVIKFYYTSTS